MKDNVENYLLNKIEELKNKNKELEDLISEADMTINKQNIKKQELQQLVKTLREELGMEYNYYKDHIVQAKNNEE